VKELHLCENPETLTWQVGKKKNLGYIEFTTGFDSATKGGTGFAV